MTAFEIENSGIYNANKIAITLKNGDVIEVWGSNIPYGFRKLGDGDTHFDTLNAFCPKYNKLLGVTYNKAKGIHSISISGEDIDYIKVLESKDDKERNDGNYDMLGRLTLVILILIGIYMSCNK